MIRACIDIGTNSTKLLVAKVEEQQIAEILKYQAVTTRLGRGTEETNMLLPEAIDQTAEVIKALRQEAERFNADEIIPVATSAVRESQNRDIFVQKVMDHAGLKVLVLPGEEEARLTYIGACAELPELRSKRLTIVDVGGGSSDFVFAQNDEIESAFSVKAGFIRLTETFFHSDPISPDELQNCIDHIKSLLNDHFAGVSTDGRHLVGTGGTIKFLLGIMRQRLGAFATDWSSLLRQEVGALFRHLSRIKLEERKKVRGLPSDRADVIVAGAAVFYVIMEMLDAKDITISNSGMRNGVLIGGGFAK